MNRGQLSMAPAQGKGAEDFLPDGGRRTSEPRLTVMCVMLVRLGNGVTIPAGADLTTRACVAGQVPGCGDRGRGAPSAAEPQSGQAH
jgi:hypothetical protein